MMTEEEIGHSVIGAAIKVHSVLGPGLLESTYQACIAYELDKLSFRLRQQAILPICYEGLVIDNGSRADLIVEDLVVLN
jgi:GxxExxY protein